MAHRFGRWQELQAIGGIKAGATSDPVISSRPTDRRFEFYGRFLGTGTHYGHDVYVEVGADTPTAFTSSVYASAARFRTEVQGTFTTGGGGIGVEGEGIIGVSGTPNGAVFGGQFYFRADAATRQLKKTYAAISLRSNVGAGNTFSGIHGQSSVAFIRAGDAGSVKLPHFLFWDQAANANSAVRALTAGANGAMSISVNVQGVEWFIGLSATAT